MEVLTTHNRTVDGRPVLHVRFERITPEAAAPVVETIYLIQWPQDFTLVGDNTVVLFLLSCTRTDSRETVELEPDELELVLESATNYAAGLDRNW